MADAPHKTATRRGPAPIGLVLGFLASVTACGSNPSSGAPCPEAEGEFPPTHCAYVQGRFTASGAPITGARLRVDEFVPPVGYAYVSDAAAIDALGRFELLVLRINQFQPPAVPDTARVYVKLYPSPAVTTPEDSFLVLMSFAPMGALVDTTQAELTLP